MRTCLELLEESWRKMIWKNWSIHLLIIITPSSSQLQLMHLFGGVGVAGAISLADGAGNTCTTLLAKLPLYDIHARGDVTSRYFLWYECTHANVFRAGNDGRSFSPLERRSWTNLTLHCGCAQIVVTELSFTPTYSVSLALKTLPLSTASPTSY